eukprot:TRINITY_DN11517_c0_g2_i1.p1 TRINITY_DN11517_c0_g2~~TRINITY_DN11517_c0_g2_i1.p1  ORF type:complete len:444 (-),score=84.20 TRINITY_DN11517_c0_g2_i1:309-1559(-)
MAGELRPLYAILGVPADASSEAIKVGYRRLALEHHPDRKGSGGGDEESNVFTRIAFAYEVLGNSQRRKRYDLTGEVPQNDAALGRAAAETFLAEYVTAAPKAPRGVTQRDMSLHSLENYEVLDVDSRDTPAYMRGIVQQGLGYLVRVVEAMEKKEVVLLRHFVMDQMYALLAYEAPLDESAFSERGYIITYYDHPLQAGIKPSWSDQNDGRPRGDANAELKHIDEATFQQRRLAALEWDGGGCVDKSAVETELPEVPGEGFGLDRLKIAAELLVARERAVDTWNIHTLRRALERLLRVPEGQLDAVRPTHLMTVVFEALEQDDDKGDGVGVAADHRPPSPHAVPAALAVATSSEGASAVSMVGSTVRVLPTGRAGLVLVHDPSDSDLTFKLRFADGGKPDEDWFGARAVEPVAVAA